MSMFTPPGEGGRKKVRRRGSGGRGGHRGRTVAVLLVLVTVGAAAGAWWWHRDDTVAVAARPRPSCPTSPVVQPVVAARDITVNVYNATDRVGLANRVARQLRKRGFVIGTVGNDPAHRAVTGVAEVRASTAGAAPARTVAAQVPAYLSVPDQRAGASVDLVLGAGYHSLRPPAVAAAALSPSPSPQPAGC
jgi:hypothetical protein